MSFKFIKLISLQNQTFLLTEHVFFFLYILTLSYMILFSKSLLIQIAEDPRLFGLEDFWGYRMVFQIAVNMYINTDRYQTLTISLQNAENERILAVCTSS